MADSKTLGESEVLTESFRPEVQPTWKWDDYKPSGIDFKSIINELLLLCTISLNGYITEIQENVYVFSESICDVVSFMDIIRDIKYQRTLHWITADEFIGKRTMEAGGSADDIEEHYAAMVGDNIATNIAGASQTCWRKVSTCVLNGCCSQCGD